MKTVAIVKNDELLGIGLENFQKDVKPESLTCSKIAKDRYLIAPAGKQTPDELTYVNNRMISSFFSRLSDNDFSGLVISHSAFGEFKLYFDRGEVAFASSQLMEHRLGEVIYKEGKISLDTWIEAASKVDREKKFGQVLIQNHLFDYSQLTDALYLQLQEIFLSNFLVEEAYFEVIEKEQKIPVLIYQPQPTRKLIPVYGMIGHLFTLFKTLMDMSDEVRLSMGLSFTPGTFQGDFLQLIEEHKVVSKIMNLSKVHEYTSISMLFRFFLNGSLSISSEQKFHEEEDNIRLFDITSEFDLYRKTVQFTRDFCEQNKINFPVSELKSFMEKTRSDELDKIAIHVDDLGFFTVGSMWACRMLALHNPAYTRFIKRRLHGLRNFIISSIMDMNSKSFVKDFLIAVKEIK